MAAIRKSRAGDCNQWSGSPHSFRSNTPDWHAFGFRPDSRRYRKQCPHADLSDEASPDDRTMATRPAKSDTPTRRHALLHPHLKLDLPVWPPQGDGISTWCHWARLGIIITYGRYSQIARWRLQSMVWLTSFLSVKHSRLARVWLSAGQSPLPKTMPSRRLVRRSQLRCSD